MMTISALFPAGSRRRRMQTLLQCAMPITPALCLYHPGLLAAPVFNSISSAFLVLWNAEVARGKQRFASCLSIARASQPKRRDDQVPPLHILPNTTVIKLIMGGGFSFLFKKRARLVKRALIPALMNVFGGYAQGGTRGLVIQRVNTFKTSTVLLRVGGQALLLPEMFVRASSTGGVKRKNRLRYLSCCYWFNNVAL